MCNERKNCAFACIAVLVMVLTCGCAPAPVSVNANTRVDDRFDIDRIFVVLDTREFDDNTREIKSDRTESGPAVADTVCFSSRFLAELAAGLEALDVEYGFHLYTGIELSKDEYGVPARQLGADAILWVRERYSHILEESDVVGLFSSREVTSFLLGAYIVRDVEDDKPAWRATLGVGRGAGDWSQMAKLLASSLVDKLVEDGFIEGRGTYQQ